MLRMGFEMSPPGRKRLVPSLIFVSTQMKRRHTHEKKKKKRRKFLSKMQNNDG